METIPMTVRTQTGQTLIQCPRPAHHLVNALAKIGAILKPDPVTVEDNGAVNVALAGGGVVMCTGDAEFFGETAKPTAPPPAAPPIDKVTEGTKPPAK